MRVTSCNRIMRIGSQMSSDTQTQAARLPKRARGKQRVAALLQAAAAVFAEKGYEGGTMAQIAARAGQAARSGASTGGCRRICREGLRGGNDDRDRRARRSADRLPLPILSRQ